MAIDVKISGFINRIIDQVVDHLRDKLEATARDLDARYHISEKVQQVIDFIKRVVDDLEKGE